MTLSKGIENDIKSSKERKIYKPYFIITISIIQIIVFLISFYINYKSTGKVISDLKDNFMIGPSDSVLIKMGARYPLCMKKNKNSTTNYYECPIGIQGTIPIEQITLDNSPNGTLLKNPFYCSTSDICGFGLKDNKNPNQWFRFFFPIFIHKGILHIVINLVFQIRCGMSLEKVYNFWRIMIIYFASGIFGFIFEAGSLEKIPVIGCSGALYGLIACVLLDLIKNWKVIVNPVKDLIILIITIIISLGFGILPFIDNFSHIGGFIMGILVSIIILPSNKSSGQSQKTKMISIIISVLISCFLFFWTIRQFYVSNKKCEWCQYLNCPPIIDICKI
ncbi:rhomboid-domain-containing protein [Anaeromyces robustus]|uniref:Rhomboid-type serine protease n=1 Tax=Anaeromyces robustus TaxID=1754192 RepID=A0A1Y1VSR9_9FUNG|nr:rhomboid-domain-containing protein [Anaeromyces robustus]|eukprot:ORX63804.1 rhomboid-domain-containing protein [Anaeromyces robustus]